MTNELKYILNTKVTDIIKDIKNYRGVHYVLSDGKGNVLESSDTRDLVSEKKLKIKELKLLAFQAINNKYSIIDQINAQAGRLTADETVDMETFISTVRAAYKNKKQQVLNAITIDEVENV